MVRFEKDKIVVEIPTTYPTTDWLDHVRDVVQAIGVIDKELMDNKRDCIYGLCNLLDSMLPDERQAKKMLEDD